MSFEVWSIAASIGTFVVITATAVAALVQLRHARSNNQIAAIMSMRETLESEKFTLARHFVVEQLPKLIADPAGRSMLGGEMFPAELEQARFVGNFFELMGTFVKLDIIDRTITCTLWDDIVFALWKKLEPVAIIRRKVGYSGLWGDFEYLAVLCERSLSKRQGDYYPRGRPRMTIDTSSMELVAAFDRERAAAASRPQASL
jgi:hypothetical protein